MERRLRNYPWNDESGSLNGSVAEDDAVAEVHRMADEATVDGQEKDPEEQESLARDLGEELTDVFARYVRGEVDYADLTFLTFETLQDLYVIASGAYELEYDDQADDELDDEDAIEQQEDLSQEPARP